MIHDKDKCSVKLIVHFESVDGEAMNDLTEDNQATEEKNFEWKAFFFICVIFFPILAVGIVAGYGFTVWMLQVFVFGPPGSHG